MYAVQAKAKVEAVEKAKSVASPAAPQKEAPRVDPAEAAKRKEAGETRSSRSSANFMTFDIFLPMLDVILHFGCSQSCAHSLLLPVLVGNHLVPFVHQRIFLIQRRMAISDWYMLCSCRGRGQERD